MMRRTLACLLCLAAVARSDGERLDARSPEANAAADLRTRIEASPKLALNVVHLTPTSSTIGWQAGVASGVAVDSAGTIYEIERGSSTAPVLVLDQRGNVLRSWGKGDFELPHTIRIDPAGDIWTVDAGSSTIIEYSPLGRKRLTIHVGEQTLKSSPFRGTTDLAFGPQGHLFITDGYSNARVLEYTSSGRQLRQWGKPGSGSGEFHLPHALQIDEHGIIYVADRENGRIEKFDLDGHDRGELSHLGRVYSLKLAGPVLWATMQSFDQEPGSAGSWIVKLDRETGAILGHFDVAEERAGHSIDLMPSGEPIITLGNGLLWLKLRELPRSETQRSLPPPDLRK